MKKLWIYVIAAILVVALATAGAIYYLNDNSYVAKVGDEKITNTEYKFFLGLIKYQLMNQLYITDWSSKVGNQTAEEMAKEYALEMAREHKIELMQAKKNNVKLDKEEEKSLKASFDNIIAQTGSRVEAENTIKEQFGISWSEYKSIMRDVELANKFKATEVGKFNPTDDEAKAYYDENKDNYDKATVKHILISILDDSGNKLPEDEQKKAEEKAKDILEKVKKGEDFAALVKEYSDDTASVDDGGEYTFTKGMMVKEFEDWSFDEKRKAGDTDIVKTEYGYHIMLFVKREMVPFDDVKNSIIGILKEESYSDLMENWKQDSEFSIVKNEGEYNSIKID